MVKYTHTYMYIYMVKMRHMDPSRAVAAPAMGECVRSLSFLEDVYKTCVTNNGN